MELESIRLICTEGTSNKEYTVRLNPVGDGRFSVDFTYGKVGGPLKSGTKTHAPVDHALAKKTLEKLIASKVKKGYSIDASSDAPNIQQIADTKESIGFRPMLSSPVSVEDAKRLASSNWLIASVKADGERRPIRIRHGEVFAANRRGERVALRHDFEQQLLDWAGGRSITIDCEDMGSHLYVFDLMALGEAGTDAEACDLRGMGFDDRIARLNQLVALHPTPDCLRIAKHIPLRAARDVDGLLHATREAGEEGIVLKPWDALYESGRTTTASLKIKHTNSLTAVCDGVNEGKRSIKLILRDEAVGTWRFIGSVTVPVNQSVPGVGSRVEVEYLWAQPNGSLIQPVFRGIRTHEIHADECVMGQVIIRDPQSIRGAA